MRGGTTNKSLVFGDERSKSRKFPLMTITRFPSGPSLSARRSSSFNLSSKLSPTPLAFLSILRSAMFESASNTRVSKGRGRAPMPSTTGAPKSYSKLLLISLKMLFRLSPLNRPVIDFSRVDLKPTMKVQIGVIGLTLLTRNLRSRSSSSNKAAITGIKVNSKFPLDNFRKEGFRDKPTTTSARVSALALSENVSRAYLLHFPKKRAPNRCLTSTLALTRTGSLRRRASLSEMEFPVNRKVLELEKCAVACLCLTLAVTEQLCPVGMLTCFGSSYVNRTPSFLMAIPAASNSEFTLPRATSQIPRTIGLVDLQRRTSGEICLDTGRRAGDCTY